MFDDTMTLSKLWNKIGLVRRIYYSFLFYVIILARKFHPAYRISMKTLVCEQESYFEIDLEFIDTGRLCGVEKLSYKFQAMHV